jgi:hypothetical protein
MPTCPHCGYDKAIFRGWRDRTTDKGHIIYCGYCRHYSTDNILRPKIWTNPQTVLKKFMVKEETVRDLATKYSVSKSTIHRIMLKALDNSTTWEEIAARWLQNQRSLMGDWFKNLVVDTTSFEVEGEKFTYLHAADNCLKFPLVYKLLPTPYEKSEPIESELLKLRDLGYKPNLATIDGSKALFCAIKRVYSNVPVQLCLVHLSKNLDERLRVDENTPEEVRMDRESAKNLILHVACSDKHTRQIMLPKLEQFASCCGDEKALKAVEGFLGNINEYHTIEELMGYPQALTTNLCENHIGQINNLRRRLCGFKSKETAEKYINVYWETRIKNRSFDNSKSTDSLAFLLRGHIPLERLVNLVAGIDYRALMNIVTKIGRIIISTENGSYPISAWQIERLVMLAPRVKRIGQLADIMALNPILVYRVFTSIDNLIENILKRKLNYKVYVRGIDRQLTLCERELEETFREAKPIFEFIH